MSDSVIKHLCGIKWFSGRHIDKEVSRLLHSEAAITNCDAPWFVKSVSYIRFQIPGSIMQV